MRTPRIYHPAPLGSGATITLTDSAANHVARVLRLPAGAPLILFNGDGGEYRAHIESLGKHSVTAHVGEYSPRDCESPLTVWLAQGISRGERMDYTLQKAVELGVNRIVPLFTEHCGVHLEGERASRRRGHWQWVVVSACEQCGRNRVPVVEDPQHLGVWLDHGMDSHAPPPQVKLVLDHRGRHSLADIPRPADPVALLIGPEGGLADNEIARAEAAGFTPLRLGPRVLRTETAAVAALAAIQSLWGDLAR